MVGEYKGGQDCTQSRSSRKWSMTILIDVGLMIDPQISSHLIIIANNINKHYIATTYGLPSLVLVLIPLMSHPNQCSFFEKTNIYVDLALFTQVKTLLLIFYYFLLHYYYYYFVSGGREERRGEGESYIMRNKLK